MKNSNIGNTNAEVNMPGYTCKIEQRLSALEAKARDMDCLLDNHNTIMNQMTKHIDALESKCAEQTIQIDTLYQEAGCYLNKPTLSPEKKETPKEYPCRDKYCDEPSLAPEKTLGEQGIKIEQNSYNLGKHDAMESVRETLENMKFYFTPNSGAGRFHKDIMRKLFGDQEQEVNPFHAPYPM